MTKKQYYVYIMASRSKNLYTGITNDVYRRIMEHRHGQCEGFTKRYRIERLVHYEIYDDALEAIAREKQIKGWTRAKRIALIETFNPTWQDLSEGWGEQIDYSELQIPRSTTTKSAKAALVGGPGSARDDTRIEGQVGPERAADAPAGTHAVGAQESARLQGITVAVAAKPQD